MANERQYPPPLSSPSPSGEPNTNFQSEVQNLLRAADQKSDFKQQEQPNQQQQSHQQQKNGNAGGVHEDTFLNIPGWLSYGDKLAVIGHLYKAYEAIEYHKNLAMARNYVIAALDELRALKRPS